MIDLLFCAYVQRGMKIYPITPSIRRWIHNRLAQFDFKWCKTTKNPKDLEKKTLIRRHGGEDNTSTHTIDNQ